MDINLETVLSQMVAQFEQKHKRLPKTIVMPPLAALSLAVKQSLSAKCKGVPVMCRTIDENEATKNPKDAQSLGVYLKPNGTNAQLVACDLKN